MMLKDVLMLQKEKNYLCVEMIPCLLANLESISSFKVEDTESSFTREVICYFFAEFAAQHRIKVSVDSFRQHWFKHFPFKLTKTGRYNKKMIQVDVDDNQHAIEAIRSISDPILPLNDV